MLKTILISVACTLAALLIYEFGVKKLLGLNKYEEYEAYSKAV
jgi:hypothetical protein